MGQVLFRSRELVSSYGFLLECLRRVLEMAHDQAQKMEPSALRFEKLVELETPFKQVLLLIENLFCQTLDQQIVASLQNVHRGTVLVDREVTHGGYKLPG